MVTYRVNHFCRVQARFSAMETKILFPPVMLSGCSPNQSVLFRVLVWLVIEISITSLHILQMQLQFTVACSWAFLLKPWVWQALLSFRHKWKTCSPAPFVKLIWARWQSGRCSSLQASVFCIIAVLSLDVSLATEAKFNVQFRWGFLA
jgi:hypothetical protein